MTIVTTTKGDMDTKLLDKKEGSIDNEREFTQWIEYWLNGEMIHRSVHVQLKEGVQIFPETAKF